MLQPSFVGTTRDLLVAFLSSFGAHVGASSVATLNPASLQPKGNPS
jgi:hypothetical protein